MAQVVTLSSAGTATIILNSLMRATSVIVTFPSSGTVSVEASLDDPTIFGGPATTWALLSSAAQIISSNTTIGLAYTVSSPLGGVRLNCSSNSGGGTFTLKALQAITA